MVDQVILGAGLLVALFVWGRWRYDLVAMVMLLAITLFAAGILATVLGLSPVEIAASACAMLLGRLLTLREAYEAIDWPVITLLGAMTPVGEAMETTGAAGLVAEGLLGVSSSLPTTNGTPSARIQTESKNLMHEPPMMSMARAVRP